MPVCCVENCSNSDRKGYRVFGLPCRSKSYRRREQWLINAGLGEEEIAKRKGAPHFCEVRYVYLLFLCFSIQLLCVYCVLIHLVHAKYVVNRLPHNLNQRGLPEA